MTGDPLEDWSPVDLGPVGRVLCPPNWRADGVAEDGQGAAAISPDGKVPLVAHAVIHTPTEHDFAARMEATAGRILSHLSGQAAAQSPEIMTISGAAQPILEISTIFFDDPFKPELRIRQWHAIAPLDEQANHIAVLAYSLMTPALEAIDASTSLKIGFVAGLRAQTASLVDSNNSNGPVQ